MHLSFTDSTGHQRPTFPKFHIGPGPVDFLQSGDSPFPFPQFPRQKGGTVIATQFGTSNFLLHCELPVHDRVADMFPKINCKALFLVGHFGTFRFAEQGSCRLVNAAECMQFVRTITDRRLFQLSEIPENGIRYESSVF